MITFTSNIFEKFPEETNLYVSILKKWCNGNQIEVTEKMPDENEEFIKIDSNFPWKHIFIEKQYFSNIDNSVISFAEWKWIFTQKDSVLTRCGCGKSFSFKSGNEAQDKIAILKDKLRKKKPAHK